MKKYSLFQALGILTAFCALVPLSAQAEDAPIYVRSSDSIFFDDEGRAYCLDGEERRTGRFSLEPNFLLGDITNDSELNASDAAVLLQVIAEAGTSGSTVNELLCSRNYFTDAAEATLFADTDENGMLNASDAAYILQYCAQTGVSDEFQPLGYYEYLADENGYLQKGFITDSQSGKTYYADNSYRLYRGWINVNEKRYFLGNDYTLQTDSWISDKGFLYYMQADGTILRNAWKEYNGNMYYLGNDGASLRGFRMLDGKQYYFSENGMVTGWLSLLSENYYFNEQGVLQTGWLTLGDDSFYLAEDGKRLDGLQTLDGNTYFFRNGTGAMAKGFIDVGDRICYFNDEGIMLTGFFTVNDLTYYSEADGTSCTGLQTIEGKTYYFTPENRDMVCSSWIEQPDGWRYFNEDGVSISGLIELEQNWYYLNDDGIRQTGWQTVGNERYYFNENGCRIADGWNVIEGVTYFFNNDGSHLTGWQELEGKRYYFNESGAMVTDQDVDDMHLGSDGVAMTKLYFQNKLRAQNALNQYGTSVSGIYNFVRSTTRYKKTESTKTIGQINSLGWLYFVDYSMTHYYGVCYYLAAKMDFVLTEAGYECRIVHATHGSGDHYWNQININGTWVNYDCTNGLSNYTWNQMVAYGSYKLIGYERPIYQ